MVTPETEVPRESADAPGERADRQRRRVLRVFAIFTILLAVDQFLPPQRQVSSRLLLASIHAYQRTISPHLKGRVVCRFEPSCSHYAEGAIEESGAVVGSFRAVARIARCGPWTPPGTLDPP